ncbi:HNH endonuclease family protein [Sansalvadorimonas verongulae]|uniref:HNH endonuclease family protein n=1 Tax=Sansalvadorimonas verongulae TaxID=2172824 RepID=UPI0012BCC4C2|nr:HNH endonuclease family protein [Sansalvadorimonas verongulae]MTI12322.1 HNH endonuclease [Sansalvadorimonas verongulae]
MKYFILCLSLIVHSAAYAEVIKQSSSGICHSTTSPYYERVKKFTAYSSLEECLNAGGRLPKNAKGQRVEQSHSSATTQSSEPVEHSSRSGAPKYKRSYFGRWDDEDSDCINTRHELLIKQSTSTIDTGANKCTVETGRWLDPYTGKTFYKAKDVDIDHLVPLKWAWDHGAHAWNADKRKRFANDESNLFAVQNSVNREKGAQGPLEWLPPATSFHCQYILRFTRVAKSYGLVFSKYEQKQLDSLRQKKCGR